MNVFVRTSLLGLLALPLAAQSSGFSAGGAIIYGFDSLKKVTNSNVGITVNGAFDATIYGSDIPARISLAYANIPGKQTSYSTATTDGHLRTTLNLIQLSGDILVASGKPELKGVFGLSFNKYSLNKAGNEDTTAANSGNPSAHFPAVDDKGVKLGLRLGLDYTINKSFSAEVIFQQTELAGAQRNDSLVRRGGLNPGWLQFGARYHF